MELKAIVGTPCVARLYEFIQREGIPHRFTRLISIQQRPRLPLWTGAELSCSPCPLGFLWSFRDEIGCSSLRSTILYRAAWRLYKASLVWNWICLSMMLWSIRGFVLSRVFIDFAIFLFGSITTLTNWKPLVGRGFKPVVSYCAF